MKISKSVRILFSFFFNNKVDNFLCITVASFLWGCSFKSSEIQISFIKTRSIDSISSSFKITGVTGIYDTHLDEFFTDISSAPEIRWGAMDQADTYKVELTGGSNNQVLCQIENISPSSNPTATLSELLCPGIFLDGSIYFVKVTAKFKSGKQIVADNSPFAFKVNRLASNTASLVTGSSPVVADGIQESQIVIELKNEDRIPLENRQISITSSGQANTLNNCTPTDTEGKSQCRLSSTRAELKTVTLTPQSNTVGSSTPFQVSITFVPGAASELVFINQPTTGMVSASLEPEIQVALQDRYGNRLTDFNQNISITLNANPNSASLAGTLVRTAVNGVAHFDNLIIDKEGTGYNFAAEVSLSPPINKISDNFSIYEGRPKLFSDNLQWSNSLILSPLFTWEEPLSLGPGLQGYEISIGTSPGGTNILAWTSIGKALHFNTVTSLTEGQTYYGNIRAVSIENKRSPVVSTDGWTIDTTPPNPPNTISVGAVPNSLSKTPLLSWSGATDGGSGIEGSQIKIIDTSSGTTLRDWTSSVSGAAIEGLLLKPSTNYQIKLRLFDKARNFTSEISIATWRTQSSIPGLMGISFGSGQDFQLGRPSNLGSPSEALAEISLPGGLEVKEIATSTYHVCILATNGNAYCMGDNQFGQLGDGTSVNRNSPTAVAGGYQFSSLASGIFTTCGILSSNNKVMCWGHNAYGQAGQTGASYSENPVAILGDRTFKKIALGAWHSCGIETSGNIYCWGFNNVGQLGIGSSSPTTSPTPLAVSGTDWKDLALGDNHTCAIANDDTVYCWGYNASGELGKDMGTNKNAPASVSGTVKYSHLFSGQNSNCAIEKSTQSSYCWGLNSSGQLGLNPNAYNFATPTLQPPAPDGESYRLLTVSGSHGCGIASGSSYCWGENQKGQLGDGTYTFRHYVSSPTQKIKGSLSFAKLVASNRYTCGVSFNNKAYCWGDVPGIYQTHLPAPIQGGLQFLEIASGAKHSCGIEETSNKIYCWGDNSYGQLGTGNFNSSLTPSAIQGTDTFQSLGAGDYHTCGVTLSGAVKCWGKNAYGQLGDSSNTTAKSSVVAGTLTSISMVSAGYAHTCALSISNKLYCWGDNTYGQLGTGDSTTTSTTPVAVDSANNYISISAGNNVTCGIRSDNSAWCWGSHLAGQLGTGVAVDSSPHKTPEAVIGGHSFLQISVGGTHTCGIKSDGVVLCWGKNRYGQMATSTEFETETAQTSPTAISDSGTFTKIATGEYHTCAIRSSGSKLLCWGSNIDGQSGLSALGNYSKTPTLVAPHLTFSKISAGSKHTVGLGALAP